MPTQWQREHSVFRMRGARAGGNGKKMKDGKKQKRENGENILITKSN